MQLKFEKHRS